MVKMKKNIIKTKIFFALLAPLITTCPLVCLFASTSTASKIDRLFLPNKELAKKYDINESKYFHFDSVDPNNPNVFTKTRLQDHIDSVLDKTQYRLYSVGLDDSQVYDQIGKLKANIENNLTTTLLQNKSNDTSFVYSSVYKYVDEQAKIFNSSVIDYDDLYYSTIPDVCSKYEDELIDYGVDSSAAERAAMNYQNTLLKRFNYCVDNLLDDIDYAYLTAGIGFTPDLSLSYLKTGLTSLNENAKKDSILEMYLSYFLKKIKEDTLQINPKGLEMFKDYSKNNEGISESQVLTPEQISNLFINQYDLAVNYDPSQITLDDIPSTTPGDYDYDMLSFITLNGPFSSLKTQHCAYGMNEILPGYTINVKYIGMDDQTDSNQALSIHFQFGINKTNDSYIFWNPDVESVDIDFNDEDLGDIYNYNTSISSYHDLIKNITNNVYSENYNFNASINATPSTSGIYFVDSADKRTSLDKIMNKYKPVSGDSDSSYDLERNPIILDPEDYQGIPVPTDIANNINNVWHTNQSLALIATHINTNTNVLQINWAIVNKNIEPNSDVSNNDTENDFIVVKNIPWNVNGQLLDKIPVQYEISYDLKTKISNSENDYSIFSYMHDASDFAGNILNKQGIDKLSDIVDQYKSYQIALIVSGEIANAAFLLLIPLNVYFVGAATPALVFEALLTLAFIAFQIYQDVQLSKDIENCESSIESSYEIHSIFGSDEEAKSFYDNISKYKEIFDSSYEIITNPYSSYDKKEECADIIDENFVAIDNENKAIIDNFVDYMATNDDFDKELAKAELAKKYVSKTQDDFELSTILTMSFGSICVSLIPTIQNSLITKWLNALNIAPALEASSAYYETLWRTTFSTIEKHMETRFAMDVVKALEVSGIDTPQAALDYLIATYPDVAGCFYREATARNAVSLHEYLENGRWNTYAKQGNPFKANMIYDSLVEDGGWLDKMLDNLPDEFNEKVLPSKNRAINKI